MPNIFDNISDETRLVESLKQTIDSAYRADFCIGYLNLRGWGELAPHFEDWTGTEDNHCRVLVGMQRPPKEVFRLAQRQFKESERIDNATASRLKKQAATAFREQLTVGAPSNADETALRLLVDQLQTGKVRVKLFLAHQLHAKLYLLHLHERVSTLGYIGSSNLTFSGLRHQGELNMDVTDGDATKKLTTWFEERWEDRWCIDISEDLIEIIEDSWAREDLIPPYHIYVKMAYHLAQEARTGLHEFNIPSDLDDMLFDYQRRAVKIAAHHLNKRGGVLIGDVVGLGKSFIATALARIFEDDFGLETLIICPKNLVDMWEKNYRQRFGLRGRVMSITQVIRDLPTLRRYRLVILDESHNLRNREGRRYRAIQDYIQTNDSRCILLSATPYNKTYLDLSNQLRLFIPEDEDLGIRPEALLREIGETEFIRRHQAGLRTLAAFEKSQYIDDWRELMRLFMIRRTRTFIKQNHSQIDPENNRYYLEFADGTRNYFPARVPQTVGFHLGDNVSVDQYAFLYDTPVVDAINALELPRYGLGQYTVRNAENKAEGDELDTLNNLSRAGRRLMGFCRTNLFKRLESSGEVFLLSLERHILRNYVYLYALENNLPLPIGTQDAAMLDTRTSDIDVDETTPTLSLFETDEDFSEDEVPTAERLLNTLDEAEFEERAKGIYEQYATQYQNRFKWLKPGLFQKKLTKHLRSDAQSLLGVMQDCGDWRAFEDVKLDRLVELITETHPDDKILIFTQFADTVRYLERELQARRVERVVGVTGGDSDPTTAAQRFSPRSNEVTKYIDSDKEIRVLIATDVLSEGQNLQDCAIVVNYDLPWAIIRLIQRAGRVDRIGQQSDIIHCYTFLPADGIDRILRLRARVRQRLTENAEVVGTDEAFFEEDIDQQMLLNLYNEQAGILDEDDDGEVDLASYAYQIWQNAIDRDPSLERTIPQMQPVSYSTRHHIPYPLAPEGVLVYTRTSHGTDLLAWANEHGETVSESQYDILNAARCSPDTPALPRADYHHEAVSGAIREIIEKQRQNPGGGQLGRPSGARFKAYERLKAFAQAQRNTLLEGHYEANGLYKAIDEIYQYPLRPVAKDALNRQFKAGITDESLAELVMNLREEDRLCLISDDHTDNQEPRIICSLGLTTQDDRIEE